MDNPYLSAVLFQVASIGDEQPLEVLLSHFSERRRDLLTSLFGFPICQVTLMQCVARHCSWDDINLAWKGSFVRRREHDRKHLGVKDDSCYSVLSKLITLAPLDVELIRSAIAHGVTATDGDCVCALENLHDSYVAYIDACRLIVNSYPGVLSALSSLVKCDHPECIKLCLENGVRMDVSSAVECALVYDSFQAMLSLRESARVKVTHKTLLQCCERGSLNCLLYIMNEVDKWKPIEAQYVLLENGKGGPYRLMSDILVTWCRSYRFPLVKVDDRSYVGFTHPVSGGRALCRERGIEFSNVLRYRCR